MPISESDGILIEPGTALEAAPGVIFEITGCDDHSVTGRFSGEAEFFTFRREEVSSFITGASIPTEIDSALMRMSRTPETRAIPSINGGPAEKSAPVTVRFRKFLQGGGLVPAMGAACLILMLTGMMLFLRHPAPIPSASNGSSSPSETETEVPPLAAGSSPGADGRPSSAIEARDAEAEKTPATGSSPETGLPETAGGPKTAGGPETAGGPDPSGGSDTAIGRETAETPDEAADGDVSTGGRDSSGEVGTSPPKSGPAKQIPGEPMAPPAWDSPGKPPELLSLDELQSGAGGKSPLSVLPEEFMKSLDEAEALLNGGKPVDAIVKLRPLFLMNPKNPRVNTFLGRAYMSLGLTEMAVVILNRAQELSPGSLDILVFLGRTSAVLGRMDSFDQWLSKARKAEPSRKTVDLLFAEALADAGKFEDASALLPPDSDGLSDGLARIHTRMKARTLLKSGRPADAFDLLRVLAMKDGFGTGAAQSLETMMEAAKSANLWARAVRPLKAMISREEESGQAYGWLGKTLYILGDPAAAAEAFEKYFSLEGRRKGDFLEVYGQCLFGLGRAYEATAAFDEARILMGRDAPESLVSTINRLRILTDPDPF